MNIYLIVFIGVFNVYAWFRKSDNKKTAIVLKVVGIALILFYAATFFVGPKIA